MFRNLNLHSRVTSKEFFCCIFIHNFTKFYKKEETSSTSYWNWIFHRWEMHLTFLSLLCRASQLTTFDVFDGHPIKPTGEFMEIYNVNCIAYRSSIFLMERKAEMSRGVKFLPRYTWENGVKARVVRRSHVNIGSASILLNSHLRIRPPDRWAIISPDFSNVAVDVLPAHWWTRRANGRRVIRRYRSLCNRRLRRRARVLNCADFPQKGTRR